MSADTDPRDRPPGWRARWVTRYLSARNVVWSWLFDPALLVYRRHGFGQKRVRAIIVEIYLFVREVIRDFYTRGEVSNRAASLAYTTLLSLIPLLVAFTYSLSRYFSQAFPGLQSSVDSILNSIIPYQSPLIQYHLARFRENATTASTVGVVVFMVIAFRLFLAVEGAVNSIWNVRSRRGYKQKIIAFTMLFFWGPLLMGLSFTTTAMLERNRYLRVLLEGDFLFVIVPVFILFVGFTMVFWLVPSARVRLSAAALGALVTTLLFTGVRWGFGIYAQHLFKGRFNLIYGTAGLIIMFLIAIEVMWVVILLGVQISYVWQNLYGLLRATEQQVKDQPQFDLYFALRGMIEIARRFDRREDPPSSYRLAEQFGTTDSQIARVMRKLEDGKLVAQTGGDWIGYVPACDPDRITIDEVVAQLEGVMRSLPDIGPDDHERAAVGALFQRLNQCTVDALDRMTIGRLVRDLYSPREVRGDDRVTM
ncbi:MAG TPA: YhjD/YihY/BrkB family envelope integrity protein [Thermoanaerobaculia bacterium]|nr:YhjD/YihY/BrkB family envelope integrity protein [Thermoanaerobaculia bacterium]